MKRYMIQTYADLMKKFFNVEVSFKQKFQIQTIEWSYYGQYSGGSRFYVVLPIRAGERLLVEIRKNPIERNKIKKLLKEWEQAVKTNDYEKYQQTITALFDLIVRNRVQIFREVMEGDTLKRIRVESKWDKR